jgi:phenylalanyl-tRNA synthetase alpha chain
MDDVDTITESFLTQISAAGDTATLEDLRVAALGRKGGMTGLMKTLGQTAPEDRKALGQRYNQAKDKVAAALDSRRSELDQLEMLARLGGETVDVTLPVRPGPAGKIHPISQVMEEITAIFADMGFAVAEGPDIEDDFHNFTALNIPPEHPARQMHDTFYLDQEANEEKLVMRTHTSPVQIRHMQSTEPPYRIIAPGRTYRSDSDQTHTPMFHQIEGLAIDRDIHMGHLKGCLVDFARTIFGIEDLPFRFRPSHFPFTEPSAEMDIGCSRVNGELHIGGGDDWLEILGCGMVHPKVLKHAGVDPNTWQGFAFGLGIDRIAMLKYGIADLRSFFDGDVRWLRHYGFDPLDVPSLAAGLVR